jgi:hypothetical protein
MKKLCLVFALCLGLMSFSENSEEKKEQIQTCCTATLVVNGEPVASATQCINGIGPETSALACAAATGKLKKQLAEITQE